MIPLSPFGYFFSRLLVVYVVWVQRWGKQGRDSLNWPGVTGRILEARTKEIHSEDGGFKLKVRYEYTVDGRTYTSTRIAFGDVQPPLNDEGAARLALNARQPGAIVHVYYNPADPSTATLERGAPNATRFFIWGVGVLLFLIAMDALNQIGVVGG